MKHDSARTERICPLCLTAYRQHPAISRRDNATGICPACGCREAMASIGIPSDEQERILGIMKERHIPKICN